MTTDRCLVLLLFLKISSSYANYFLSFLGVLCSLIIHGNYFLRFSVGKDVMEETLFYLNKIDVILHHKSTV